MSFFNRQGLVAAAAVGLAAVLCSCSANKAPQMQSLSQGGDARCEVVDKTSNNHFAGEHYDMAQPRNLSIGNITRKTAENLGDDSDHNVVLDLRKNKHRDMETFGELGQYGISSPASELGRDILNGTNVPPDARLVVITEEQKVLCSRFAGGNGGRD